jgi:hypothetical protein
LTSDKRPSAVPEGVEAEDSEARGHCGPLEPSTEDCSVPRTAQPIAEDVVLRAGELDSRQEAFERLGGAVDEWDETRLPTLGGSFDAVAVRAVYDEPAAG